LLISCFGSVGGLRQGDKNGDLFKAAFLHRVSVKTAHNALFAIEQVGLPPIELVDVFHNLEEWQADDFIAGPDEWALLGFVRMADIEDNVLSLWLGYGLNARHYWAPESTLLLNRLERMAEKPDKSIILLRLDRGCH